MTSNVETWAPVPSWPGYEASTLGAVRRIGASKPLTPTPSTQRAYLTVHVSRDGKSSNVYLHRLVAEAHLGPIEGRVVHHINTCVQDCRVENLVITTQGDNVRRAQTDRTAHIITGERAPEAWGRRGYLTPVQVQTLRRAKATGKRGAVAELAREYNCPYHVAQNAASGVTYTYVGATALETELVRQEALAERAARKTAAQVSRAKAARAAHTPPAAAASARPRFSATKKEGK